MLIEVNIGSCIANGITASEYCFLQLLWQRKVNTAIGYKEVDTNIDINRLIKLGYLLYYNEKGFCIDQKKCNELFGLVDGHFWEFYSTFPLVGGVGSKTRSLRSADPRSKNALDAKSKYSSCIKTKPAHKHVMACLRAEIQQRTQAGTLVYMQNILTWLNQRTWQLSEYLLKSEEPKNKGPKHGEGLI